MLNGLDVFHLSTPDRVTDLRRQGGRTCRVSVGGSLLTALALLVGSCATAGTGEAPATLKEAFAADFPIGAAVNERLVTGQEPGDEAIVLAQFDSISPENCMKWARIHPRPGPDGYEFRAADAYVAFGEAHHLLMVGHTLAWHHQTPAWVFEDANGRPLQGSKPADRALLLQRLHDHIMTVVGRYKGRVKIWDVVNEAVSDSKDPADARVLRPNSPWVRVLGEEFIVKAFEWAHEADPDAILRYNDYAIENAPKRRRLIALIRSLQAQHVPVMAIGSQMHATVSWPSPELEDETLTDLASLGLPVHITELDLSAARAWQHHQSADITPHAPTAGGLVDNADRKLADAYAGLFRIFLKHRRTVRLVTFWGVTDRTSWRRHGAPLLFDRDGKPKPAFAAVIQTALHPPPPAD